MRSKERKRRRDSIRLTGYDYSQPGAYFVTICTRKKFQFFEDTMLSEIVEECWGDIPNHFPGIEIDEFVVMPNHFHGIVFISSDQRRGVQLNAPTESLAKSDTDDQIGRQHRFTRISPKKGSLGVIIRIFKGEVTRRIRAEGQHDFGWQRGYFDRVIRDREELNRIRKYISENPQKWELEEYHLSKWME